MRTRIAVSLLIGLSFAALAMAAPTDRDIARQLDAYLSIRSDMGAFSGAVLVARDGHVVFRRGYGFADVERRTPYTPDTRHEVASISKMFTAMAALKLRDEGKLRLDDPICRYIEGCPESWRPITIQHLMRHTSGIPDYESRLEFGSAKYTEFMTQPDASKKIFDEARTLPLDFRPGEKFNYSNTGYIVLSRIIERAAGVPFDRFVTRHLLRPAGMKHSGVLSAKRPRGLAVGYTHGEWGWEKIVAGVPLAAGGLTAVPVLPLTSPEGDAFLYTTLDDLHRWSTIMDGSDLVPQAEAAEVFTPGLDDYGYGWFIGQGFGRRRMRHNGALPGYTSDFVKFPDDKITIIIFCNLDRAPMVHIARDVSSIVLGIPYDMPIRGKVVRLSEAEIKGLEGTYRMADGSTLTIRNDPRFLTAEVKDRFTAGLIPLSADFFYVPLTDGRATFTRGSDGTAERVNLRYSGTDHVATRVP